MDANLSQSVISGVGKVNGRDICIYAQNSAVKGGSLGRNHARRIANIMRMALQLQYPIVAMLDSGGARIQEGVDALSGYGEIFRLCSLAKGKVLQIAVVLGACAGGAAYSPALMDITFTVRGLSRMFINGPAVIKSNTGEDIDAESLGGADVLATISGNANFVYDTEQQCLDGVRNIIELTLGSSVKTEGKYASAPEKTNTDGGIHGLIHSMCDHGSAMEVSENYARNCVTALARIGGKSVGIVANNGNIDIDAADKIAAHIQYCDNFGLPIITFTDIKAFECSRAQEHGGLIRHGSRIIYEYSTSTVKKITVITGNALGGGFVAMGSKSLGADVVLAWKGAQVAVMPPEAAVNVIYRKQLAENPELRASLIEQYRKEIADIDLSAHIDRFINPEDTRDEIIKALDSFLIF